MEYEELRKMNEAALAQGRKDWEELQKKRCSECGDLHGKGRCATCKRCFGECTCNAAERRWGP